MHWLIIILSSLCLFVCWLLLAPVELEIDTKQMNAEFRWLSLGRIRVWHEKEWKLSMHLFFFNKTILFSKIKKRPKKVRDSAAPEKQKRKLKTKRVQKIIQAISTLQITEWQLVIDSGEFHRNARLYPLNFLPGTCGHLQINFQGQNFLTAKIKGRPWKILYAYLK